MAAMLQRQLTKGRIDKCSPATCRSTAVVHFASEEAGVLADRTASPHMQLLLRQPSSMRKLLVDAGPAASADDMPPGTAHR